MSTESIVHHSAGAPDVSAAALEAAQRKARSYRLLFYLALLVGFAAAGVAWHYKPGPHSMRLIDVSYIVSQRDNQFEFTAEIYGYKRRGKSGNSVDEHTMLFGLYEKDRLYFMRDYLQRARIPGAVFVDVGANTGNHSMFLSDYAAQVHAIEPYPPAIQRLRENLALNPEMTNVIVHEVGLSDQEAELPFVRPPDGDTASGSFNLDIRINEPGHQLMKRKLKVVVGDQLLASLGPGPIALIKIDVECYDRPVLLGLQKTLREQRPVVVLELGDVHTLEDLRAIFPERYEFVAFDRSLHAAVTGRYNLRPLSRAIIDQELGKLDIVAYPGERQALVQP